MGEAIVMRTLLGCVMISNAALFFFGALQHAGIAIGRFHEPRIVPATIVESLCGLSLVWGVAAVFGHSHLEWRTAMHYRASTGELEELMAADPPLGIVAGQRFASSKLRLESGDLLAIITDGFTETFDSGDNEFGMERVKQVLYASGTEDLRFISTEIRARALAHGEQRDDQTILLIRRLR